jgi:hypothetical protein
MVQVFTFSTWRVFQYITLVTALLGTAGIFVNFNLMDITAGRASLSSPTIAAWTAMF